MNKLGSKSAASSDGAFLMKALPRWLNEALSKPEISEDPCLKLFVFHKDPADLHALGKKPFDGKKVITFFQLHSIASLGLLPPPQLHVLPSLSSSS
jgi:hypothetical protein